MQFYLCQSRRTINPIQDPVIKEIAAKYNVSPAQVILKWDLENGHICLNLSRWKHPLWRFGKNMQSNLQVNTFELSSDDIKAIDALDKEERLGLSV